MILATASALHGHNTLSKGILIAISAGIYAVLYCYFLGWLGLIALVLVPIWWFGLRGSKQARVELDKMDTWNKPIPAMLDVMKAHYYTGLLTCLSLYFFNYDKRPDLVNNGKFWDCRRPTEIATGLTADIILGLLTVATWWVVSF